MYIYLCKYSPVMFLFAYTCLLCLKFTQRRSRLRGEPSDDVCEFVNRNALHVRLPGIPQEDPLGIHRNPGVGSFFWDPAEWFMVVHLMKKTWRKSWGNIDDFQLFFFGGDLSLVVFWVVENESVLWCRWSVQNFTFSSFLRMVDPESGNGDPRWFSQAVVMSWCTWKSWSIQPLRLQGIGF